MMDPLSVISLTSSIVQFVDFGSKLIKGAIEIYSSATSATDENRSLEARIVELRTLSTNLESHTNPQQTADESALVHLATECKILSVQILELLKKIKPKDVLSKRQSLWATLKDRYYEKEKMELEKRLASCQSQLELHLSFLNRFYLFPFDCQRCETECRMVSQVTN
jgi:hypothetical protein